MKLVVNMIMGSMMCTLLYVPCCCSNLRAYELTCSTAVLQQ